VSPAARHDGHDMQIVMHRHAVYQQARQRNPRRWSGGTRNWSCVHVVTLNPERDTVPVETANETLDKQPVAA